MSDDGVELFRVLEASRRREKGQTLFYRRLAARAEDAGRADVAERLNGLHADEQHHLSRLTARMLELGGRPDSLRDHPTPTAELRGWEAAARERELDEVRWYEGLLEEDALDETSRAVVEEILASERHHAERLGGKWMSA